eukprot:TRINITY_DN6165_c0_g1_i2.p1 TRINITY_DN6165_c0_g1~~TRINITY_DN6165_c0_g1_i2.p1  ORF type:complete len:633 (-),score=88.25 TRINITY_DN6165_c0_g1_i2:38-1936(-)
MRAKLTKQVIRLLWQDLKKSQEFKELIKVIDDAIKAKQEEMIKTVMNDHDLQEHPISVEKHLQFLCSEGLNSIVFEIEGRLNEKLDPDLHDLLSAELNKGLRPTVNRILMSGTLREIHNEKYKRQIVSSLDSHIFHGVEAFGCFKNSNDLLPLFIHAMTTTQPAFQDEREKGQFTTKIQSFIKKAFPNMSSLPPKVIKILQKAEKNIYYRFELNEREEEKDQEAEEYLIELKRKVRSDDHLQLLISLYLTSCYFDRFYPSDDLAKYTMMIRKVNPSDRRIFLLLANGLQKVNIYFHSFVVAELIESTCEEYLCSMASDPETKRNNLRFVNISENSIVDLVRTRRSQDVDAKLNDILKGLEGAGLEKFSLRKINHSDVVCPVINILISGFLSEETDHRHAWDGFLTNGTLGEYWVLEWPAYSYMDIVKDVVPTLISWALSPVTIEMVLLNLFLKSNDNLFTKCFEKAEATGRALGNIIAAGVFGHCAINLIGFSLGTQIIYSCLKQLQRYPNANASSPINNVVFIGGVANSKYFNTDTHWNQIQGIVANFYTSNDAILKYLLRLAKGHRLSVPVGTSEINIEALKSLNGKLRNYDMTEVIDGHTGYRKKLEDIFLNLEKDNLSTLEEMILGTN